MMREALSRIEELQSRLRAAEAPRHEPVAIVGLGCRFPGAPSTADYWRLLSEGVDAIAEIPPSRWDVDACYDPDPDAPGKMYTRHGGFLDGIDGFDAGFFGMSPREAISLDPQQRLLMESCWEALESAGIPADSLGGTASGVFVGIGGVDYYQRLAAREPAAIDAYMASGNAHSVASGRLSFLLGLQGPSLSVDTACSSSLVALHLACRSLRDRECDLALTGGVSVILSPAIHFNHCRSRMLAADGRCKAFDAAADGFIRSEGCGIVVLKRLSDAGRDGDRILAVIRGSAVNQDGRTSALTVPNGPAQQAVIRAALADARVEPSQISYVEAHGTGTALGDPIEAEALGAVFAGREAPLPIGSVKTNIGHAEAAAGIAGLIKVVLAMQHREIPPQLHFDRPNPRIEWDRLPLRVVTTPVSWGPHDASVYAGVSSFGFGGTNAHVIVEGPRRTPAPATAPRVPRGLLVLSARTPTALQAVAGRYRAALSDPQGAPPWPAACAEAAFGRAHMPIRAAVAAADVSGACAGLDALVAGRAAAGVWRGEAGGDLDGRVAFVYPGQGALRWGMGRELYESHPVYHDAIDRCAAALRDELRAGLLDLLYGQVGKSLIDRTELAQPALFATEFALTALWASLGIRPAAVLGHSVGEFAAACAAGVLDVEDACRLVAARGRLMQPLGGRMAVVAASDARVRELLASHPGVAVAALNGRRQVVVSGERDRVDAVMADAARAGLASKAMTGDVAFHSALMEPMLPAWGSALARARFGQPQCDWVSTVTARDVAPDECGPSYWIAQVRQPVRFAAAAERLWAMGCRIWLEIGPTAGLVTLGAEAAGAASPEGVWIAGLRSGRPESDSVREGLAQVYVAGARVDWTGWYGARPARVALPTYPFERARYWIDSVDATPAAALPATPAYEVRWDAAALSANGPGASPGSWAVCGGRAETIAAIASVLEQHGARVVTQLPDASDLAGVVHVGGLDVAVSGGMSAGAIQDAAVRGCMGVVETLRQASATAPGARVWVVTRGAVVVDGSDRDVAVAQAPLWGLGKVAALEHPESWGGLLDLDPHSDSMAGLEQILIGRADDQIAVRGERLFVPRLQAASVPRAVAAVRPDATCLITGGLGALGLEVAGRLADAGAQHLVLLGRRAPDDATHGRLDCLRRRGVAVTVECADVTDAGQMRGVLDRIAAQGPPLRGVVHAAGANGSRAIADLDAATLTAVAAAKIAGAWLLHDLTRESPLDFFVCFSSIASVWGSKGQAHYAAANAFLDGLVSHRVAQGQPALALQWGPWAAGGMATAEAQGWLSRVGVQPLTTAAALGAFGTWLSSSGHVAVADIAWARFLEVYEARRAHAFFGAMRAPGRAASGHSSPPDPGHAEAIRTLGPIEGRSALTRLVRDHVVGVLNLDARQAPAPHQGFFSIGFDSLLALELKNRLAAALRAPLPSTLAFDYSNIRDLTEYLAHDVLRLDVAPAAAPGARRSDIDVSIETTLGRLDRLMGKR